MHPEDLDATEALFNKLFDDPDLFYKAEYRLLPQGGALDLGARHRTHDAIAGRMARRS